MNGMTIYTLRILKIEDETMDTKTFFLAVENGSLSYRAGQFLTLIFPDRVNEKRRSYSISSNAALGEPLAITVKRIDNGEFSRHLFDHCQEGDALYSIGASGFFTLPDEMLDYDGVMMYAAGSGITPMLPLIKELRAFHPAIDKTLVYSNASPARTIFLRPLTAFEGDSNSPLKVEWFFSDAKDLSKARLSKVHVQRQIEAMDTQRRMRTLFFLCGPHAYMQMIEITLLREGIDRRNVRKEIFDVVKPAQREIPPDTQPHIVHVNLNGADFSFEVRYPTTILEAAKRSGIVLPYSCEAGKCGTCAATCKDGAVWMSENEVLLERELESGRILTCTGYPIGGDATLIFP
jgi:ferredoxin-NADP reductase